MSKTDCLSADWNTVGYQVGFDGERDIQKAFQRRVEVCADYGVVADLAQFQLGHAEGIEEFCGEQNAVLVGSKGRFGVLDKQICPELDYPGFTKAFTDGTKLYELNRLARDAELDLRRLENDVHRIRQRRSDLKRKINSGELSEQQVSRADYSRKRLRRDIYYLEQEIYVYRERVARHRAQARRYEDFIEVEYGDPWD